MATDTATSIDLTRAALSSDRLSGLRIYRLAAAFVSVGYAAYGIVAIPAIVESTRDMRPWWTIAALIFTFAPGLALGAFGWSSPSRIRIQRLAGWAVAGFAITLATWPLGWSGTESDSTTGFWFSMFFGVGALASALAFRARYAFLTLFVFSTGCTLVNHALRPDELNDSLLADASWAFGFSLLFVAAATMVVSTANTLDTTREEAYAATSAAASVSARAAERARFAALIHDNVMATLLAASRRGSSMDLTASAREALVAIDQAATGGSRPEVTAAEFVERIASAAANSAHPAQYRVIACDSNARFPAEVVDVLSGATAEACRNSARHAGPGSTLTVEVTVAVGELVVVISDDGVGFDPSAVPASRFGISLSIRGRTASLTGGNCSIRSAPGSGTHVQIGWTA